jgi:16S rRNA processing protein RimM
MLLVGVVARTRGIKGEVIVNATTDFPDERFAEGAAVWGRAPDGGAIEQLTVAQFRMHLARPVVRFAQAASIEEAERYTGWELRVPASAARRLPPNVYYHHDLVGCELWTAAGQLVGTVTRVEGDGQSVRLVVRARRGEVLVPFVQAFCAVDIGARRIVVTPPEGLLEANDTWPD